VPILQSIYGIFTMNVKKVFLKKTVIGYKVAHLKQQKLDVSIDFHALCHHYSAARSSDTYCMEITLLPITILLNVVFYIYICCFLFTSITTICRLHIWTFSNYTTVTLQTYKVAMRQQIHYASNKLLTESPTWPMSLWQRITMPNEFQTFENS